jgi:hypothetical protein
MSSMLNWRVPSRAQSAASVSPTWTRPPPATSPTSTPVEDVETLWGLDTSHENTELYFTNRYRQSPASSSSYSVPSRPASGQSEGSSRRAHSAATVKRYWELGGLGPTSVATPEWQLLKERWMAKQAFGKAATAANRLARLRARGKNHQEEADKATVEPEVILSPDDSTEEKDDSLAVLEERAKRRDIALALKL